MKQTIIPAAHLHHSKLTMQKNTKGLKLKIRKHDKVR